MLRRRSLSLSLLLATVALTLPILTLACKKKGMATPQRCEGLLSSAGAELRAAEKALSEGDFCGTDADCMEVESSRCTSMCNGHAIPSAKTASFKATVKKVEADQCATWEAEDCARIAPRPVASCAVYVPACRENHCKMVDRRSVLTAAECEDLFKTASDRTMEAARTANRSCRADADCVLAGGPSCVTHCGGPILSSSGKAEFDRMNEGAESACKAWREGGCPQTTPKPVPSCQALLPKCQDGTCVDGHRPPPRR